MATCSLVMVLLLPTLTRGETAVQAWVQVFNGNGAIALAMDAGNNVIVTGTSSGDYATIKYSSLGVPLWTNRYNGGSGNNYAAAVAVDSSNSVIVTGHSASTNTYLEYNYDYATIKYSSEGVPLWTNRYNGPGNYDDAASAVAVDTSDNVIVSGNSFGLSSYYDYTTIKYSATGLPLWTNRYNGPANDHDVAAHSIALDGSNDVIVTGYSYASPPYPDYATIKYSSAGLPLWTNRYRGPANGNSVASAVAVDGSNNVVATGHSTGSGSGSDYTTINYSAAGVPLWTNRYNGPAGSSDEASAVVIDGSNNVIVTGYSSSLTSYNDYATIKYSSAGVPLWTNRYNGPGNTYDQPTAVAVDRGNNVIVTGYSPGSGTGADYATIKYSSAGVPSWTNRYDRENGSDYARAVLVDRSGNVIVTGSSGGFVTLKYICVPSPVMTAVQHTNGAFHLRVDDVLQPGTLVIQASTNLVAWRNIFTNSTPTNSLFYADPDAGNAPTRFYRASQFP